MRGNEKDRKGSDSVGAEEVSLLPVAIVPIGVIVAVFGAGVLLL
jgi:hypothetical protein